jgi:uncharacterized protein YjbJ (UPF0337 family)
MDSDRVAGATQQAKGKVEATTGRLTGDTKLQVEGWLRPGARQR